jgi:hypothetical protein
MMGLMRRAPRRPILQIIVIAYWGCWFAAHLIRVGEHQWAVVPPLLVLAVSWGMVHEWRGKRSEYWTANGCCSQCGYDLRASPDRCPECGAVRPKSVDEDEEDNEDDWVPPAKSA